MLYENFSGIKKQFFYMINIMKGSVLYSRHGAFFSKNACQLLFFSLLSFFLFSRKILLLFFLLFSVKKKEIVFFSFSPFLFLIKRVGKKRIEKRVVFYKKGKGEKENELTNFPLFFPFFFSERRRRGGCMNPFFSLFFHNKGEGEGSGKASFSSSHNKRN